MPAVKVSPIPIPGKALPMKALVGVLKTLVCEGTIPVLVAIPEALRVRGSDSLGNLMIISPYHELMLWSSRGDREFINIDETRLDKNQFISKVTSPPYYLRSLICGYHSTTTVKLD